MSYVSSKYETNSEVTSLDPESESSSKSDEDEPDFNEEELLKYMMCAHKEGVSFNDWIENVLEEFIKLEDEKMLDKLNQNL